MTDSPARGPDRAFEDHDAFRPVADSDADYRVTTTAFEGTVFLPEDDGTYALVVRPPTLEAATADAVGAAVAVGWFETFETRLGDAPAATRHDVSLTAFGVAEDGDEVVVRYEFEVSNPRIATEVTKTFAEFVEGTYVEGVVPGYEYEGAVAELLGRAAAEGSEGASGGTPL